MSDVERPVKWRLMTDQSLHGTSTGTSSAPSRDPSESIFRKNATPSQTKSQLIAVYSPGSEEAEYITPEEFARLKQEVRRKRYERAKRGPHRKIPFVFPEETMRYFQQHILEEDREQMAKLVSKNAARLRH